MNEGVDGGMHGWRNRGVKRYTDSWLVVQIDKSVGNGLVDRWMNKWVNGYMDNKQTHDECMAVW